MYKSQHDVALDSQFILNFELSLTSAFNYFFLIFVALAPLHHQVSVQMSSFQRDKIRNISTLHGINKIFDKTFFGIYLLSIDIPIQQKIKIGKLETTLLCWINLCQI